MKRLHAGHPTWLTTADDKTVHDAVSDNVKMVVFEPRHSFLSPFRNYAQNCSGTCTSRPLKGLIIPVHTEMAVSQPVSN